MKRLLGDARFALRSFRRDRAVYATAALTLALGIGANTAIFSVVDAVLLRPLPYQDAERIQEVWTVFTGLDLPHFWLSEKELVVFRERVDAFSSLAGYEDERLVLTGHGEPRQLRGERVSPAFFQVLAQEAEHGRTFLPEEEQPGRGRVAVVSHGLWRDALGADPGAVGKTLLLDGESYEVVGVMPVRFRSPGSLVERGDVDLWVPLEIDSAAPDVGNHYLQAIGRLAAGRSADRARAQLASAVALLAEEHPANYQERFGFGADLGPLAERVAGEVRPMLLILLGAVALVLLIACANIANLLLSRAEKRRGEMAIRSALGAGRKQIFRQLLTESTLLALFGGALGLALAYLAIVLSRNAAAELLPAVSAMRLDLPVVAFTAGISILSGVLFGLAPAVHALSANLQAPLKGDQRSTGDAGRRWGRSALVVAELALAVVLSIAAGLLVHSLRQLVTIDPGFDPDGVLAMELRIPSSRYPEEHRVTSFYRQLVENIEHLPGVASAGAVGSLPLSDTPNKQSFEIPGHTLLSAEARPLADLQLVRPRYFQALGIPVLAGRAFLDADDPTAAAVAIVDHAFVGRYLRGRDPVGTGVRLGGPEDAVYRIVGVVGNVRQDSLVGEDRGTIFIPHEQISRTGGLLPRSSMTIVVRAASSPESLVQPIKQQVWALDDLVPASPVLVEEVVGRASARNRFTALLLAVFAAVGLVLAAVGIYGVISYSATRRSREIGIRLALGAQRGQILGLIARQGLGLTLLGLAIGAVAALSLTGALSGMLYGISGRDPATFVVVLLLLGVIAMAATVIPAMRVTRTDPTTALRAE